MNKHIIRDYLHTSRKKNHFLFKFCLNRYKDCLLLVTVFSIRSEVDVEEFDVKLLLSLLLSLLLTDICQQPLR